MLPSQSSNPVLSRLGGGLVVGLALCGWLGCERDEIRAYTAPKDPAPAFEPLTAEAVPGSEPAVVQRGPAIDWTVPQGWREVPGERQMRVATFQARSGEAPVEIAISTFPGEAGGLLPNVNRWRDQINLDPLSRESLADHLMAFENGRVKGHVMDMTGGKPDETGAPTQRILAAIVDDGAGNTWFVKAMGPPAILEPHKEAFVQFARSFTASPDQPQAGQPARPAPTEGVSQVAWQRPEHWERDPNASIIVSAAFVANNAEGQARVTVTSLAGAGGGALQNINRWREQIGLPPVRSLDEQPRTLVGDRPDGSAAIIDLVASEESVGGRQRILVAMLPQQGRTWFVKMTGTESVLELEREPFEQLVQFVDSSGMSP